MLQKQIEELSNIRLRLAEAEGVFKKGDSVSFSVAIPQSESHATMLKALQKSNVDSETLMSDCCSQLLKLQNDSEAAALEVNLLRDACKKCNLACSQLISENADLRLRLTASLGCQKAMAARALMQCEVLAEAEGKHAQVTVKQELSEALGAVKLPGLHLFLECRPCEKCFYDFPVDLNTLLQWEK